MILKKGTQVKIISGKDRGKTGEILEIDRKENKGGIISRESFIHQSNVKNIDIKKKEKKVVNKWYQG